ncbi:hypothetical protein N7447_000556 [Penicillium robsamsonii]|uniref:uncharacterized protein n=1 Tax=Penicillium robsamsonii TaxID=1792511 RepID=UPI0025468EBE|nr:uncharacterized protein N7447_000556 [Penicillium robsamsonii]KAJ5834530.1 hypothetical protein N7447_000556 [Penicillium robsamsonii]
MAKDVYDELMMVSWPDKSYFHALETEHYIDCQKRAHRKGRPVLSSSIDLETTEKRNDPPIFEAGCGPQWQIKELLEDSNEGSPVPHAIMTTVAYVPANHADQSPTIHEELS